MATVGKMLVGVAPPVSLRSAQALNSSWGPQPTASVPLGHLPQELPATYRHWRTQRSQVRLGGRRYWRL